MRTVRGANRILARRKDDLIRFSLLAARCSLVAARCSINPEARSRGAIDREARSEKRVAKSESEENARSDEREASSESLPLNQPRYLFQQERQNIFIGEIGDSGVILQRTFGADAPSSAAARRPPDHSGWIG